MHFSHKNEQLMSFCIDLILGPRNKAATGTHSTWDRLCPKESLRAARGSLEQGIKQNNLYFKGLFVSVLLLIATELETAVSLPENRSWRLESHQICKGVTKA